tara:strand:- start:107 stop:1294 length:1188 start_codon:yes stop_codon:yes gene_type:complete
MSKILISAIDIRPDKIICLIAQELQIVNQGKILQLIGSGISRFPIDCTDPFSLDKKSFLEHLSEAIKKSEKEALIKVKDVYVNIDDSVHSIYLDHYLKIENTLIKDDHIKSYFKGDEFKKLYSENNTPLHSFPISYRINDSKSVSDPINLKAENLSTMWHNIISRNNEIKKIYNFFDDTDLHVKQIVLSNYASSLAVLNEMESSLGAISIDIGKTKTFLSFTLDNQLIYFETISLGSFNFTKDLSNVLSIDLNEAEQIRKRIDKLDISKEIDQKDTESLKVYESRAEEFINLIYHKIKNTKYYSLVDSNIIYTGYGSKSLLLNKIIKKKFGMSNCRLGSALRINGSKLMIENPSMSSAFGLLSYAINHEIEIDEGAKQSRKKSFFSAIYQFFKAI